MYMIMSVSSARLVVKDSLAVIKDSKENDDKLQQVIVVLYIICVEYERYTMD